MEKLAICGGEPVRSTKYFMDTSLLMRMISRQL